MEKTFAVEIFGSQAALSRAIGVSRSRISQLPDMLGQRETDRVIGAAVRLGLIDKLPERFRGTRAA